MNANAGKDTGFIIILKTRKIDGTPLTVRTDGNVEYIMDHGGWFWDPPEIDGCKVFKEFTWKRR
jgi:hypothetical protein